MNLTFCVPIRELSNSYRKGLNAASATKNVKKTPKNLLYPLFGPIVVNQLSELSVIKKECCQRRSQTKVKLLGGGGSENNE